MMLNPVAPSKLTPLAYSMPAACDLLDVSRATLDREVARGRLRVVKVGSASRITADELARYLASLPVRPAPYCQREVA